MAVKVILKQDVPNLGQAGDIKQVAPGYFRNFLMPRGLAIEATKGQIAALEASSSVEANRHVKARQQTSALAQQMSSVTIRIPVRLGEQGRIHGSVTNKDIAEALAEQAKMTVDRHKIELREPLKSIGVHSVHVKLEQGIDAQVSVELVPESEVAQA